jgi:hypothetical protein
MTRLAAALLLCGYLPGAVLLRAPILTRDRRERLDAGERAYWAIVISTLITLASALALAAFGRYSLLRVLVIDAVVTAVPLVAWRSGVRYRSPLRPDGWSVVPVALVLIGVWLYPPPAEYVLGGKDPGVYMNAGIQIAQRGNLLTFDATAAAVPANVRDLFFPRYVNQPYYSPRFMGFFLLDPVSGAVVDQFPHLYPVAIAIGYDLYGLTGARYTTMAFALLGVLGVYFLATRLAGRAAGAIAGALLSIHVVQLWYARIPNSEMLAQALIVAALLAIARAHQDDDPFFAPLGGVLLGLAPFARFDAVLATALAVAGLLLAWLTGSRLRAWFIGALVMSTALYGIYCTIFLAPYMATPRAWVAYHGWELAVGAAAATTAVLAAAWLRTRKIVRAAVITWIPRAIVAGMLTLAIYAWYFRVPGIGLAIHDANSLRMFGWYVPPAAIAAALLGLVLLSRRVFWRDPTFFVVACGTAVFVFHRIRIVPEHFWAARRFVPLILPAVIIAIAAALATPLSSRDAWPQRAATAGRYLLRAALLALVAGSFWEATAVVRPHVEYAGVIARLESLAARLGETDLLVVESRSASDLHVLALPLAYIYARPVLVLNTPKPDKVVFAQFLAWARQHYRAVYFLGGGGTDLLSRAIAVEPVASERFQIPEYDSPRNAYPTRVRYKEFDFGLYRFATPPAASGGDVIDVGEDDDLQVVRFHAKERDARGSYRWTRNVSYLSLVSIPPDARTLAIWMENGGRPPAAPPADVEVFVDDVKVGAVRVGPGRQLYTFELPAAVVSADGAATIRLRTTTWNPRATLGVADDRDLGVMVDRVEVRRGP